MAIVSTQYWTTNNHHQPYRTKGAKIRRVIFKKNHVLIAMFWFQKIHDCGGQLLTKCNQ